MLYKAMNLKTQKEVIRAARPSLRKQSSSWAEATTVPLHFSSWGGEAKNSCSAPSQKGGGLGGARESHPLFVLCRREAGVSGQPRTPERPGPSGKRLRPLPRGGPSGRQPGGSHAPPRTRDPLPSQGRKRLPWHETHLGGGAWGCGLSTMSRGAYSVAPCLPPRQTSAWSPCPLKSQPPWRSALRL